MRHFAKIDENGFVIDIIVVDDSVLEDEDGSLNEQKGIDFLKSLFPYETCDWKLTDTDSIAGQGYRKNYAYRGGTYDYVRDAFIHQKYSDRVVLNEETCQWFDPFIVNQQTPQQSPDDSTDYSTYTSQFVPENWEWDTSEKTLKNSMALKTVPVSYIFDQYKGEWI